jgi:ABC-type phosphate/phosphonate transport system substrate-binding protein
VNSLPWARCCFRHWPSADPQPLRIGLTPTLLHERHALLARWKAYLEPRLGVPVSFVLRDSYSDTMDLIKQRRLDVAWLSDYPYVLMKPHVRLLVTPLKDGRPYYRSYLIVPARDPAHPLPRRSGGQDLRLCRSLFPYRLSFSAP